MKCFAPSAHEHDSSLFMNQELMLEASGAANQAPLHRRLVKHDELSEILLTFRDGVVGLCRVSPHSGVGKHAQKQQRTHPLSVAC